MTHAHLTEPTRQPLPVTTQTRPTRLTTALQSPPPQVVVVVDASCELAPAEAAELGIHILPREVRLNGRKHVLDAERTLHSSCWDQPPRRLGLQHPSLATLLPSYRHVLQTGCSVLVLTLPMQLDPAAQKAMAARSLLLADPHTTRGSNPPRVAVFELAALGASFTCLVRAAAQGAAAGLSLHQIVTLIDRLHTTLHTGFLTGWNGPTPALAAPSVRRQRPARTHLWTLDRATGKIVGVAQSWSLPALFTPLNTMLGDAQPTVVHTTRPALLAQVNRARARAELPPLEAQPGGVSLGMCFPNGCIELAILPDAFQIGQIIDVIRRLDRPTVPRGRGVAARGGI